jgi:lipopolysaccharide export system permease protein
MSSVDLHSEIIAKRLDLNERLNVQYRKSLAEALGLEDSLRRGAADFSWNRRERYMQALATEYRNVIALRRDRSLQLFRIEFHKKFSIPFGALSFVFLAVSLGLMAKKSGQTMGFIFSLIISVIFWTMLMGGQTFAMRMGYSPFWSMWLKNILALLIGFVLFIHRIRK